MAKDKRKRVVIIGAGFGGLFAARRLAGKPVDVLLIDRNNFHTFTPLLYQVATCALDPSDISYPLREIFHKDDNIHCMMGEVTRINKTEKTVSINVSGEERQERYDYLIIAAGSSPAYFGNETFRDHAFELSSLENAVALRNHVLRLFEQAAWTSNKEEMQAMTTLVVVGGGPTGLEMAGALYELYNHVLAKNFHPNHDLKARVVLVERLPHLLNPYPKNLRQAALDQIQSLGVEVLLGKSVTEIGKDFIRIEDEIKIPTRTVIWSAGVQATGMGDYLGVKPGRGNRIPVEDTMVVKGQKKIYAIGDNVYLENQEGEAYPMLIPVAQQQGILAAQNILSDIQGKEKKSFRYRDRGIMATIGRSRAVAWIFNKIALRGYVAWTAWLFLHLLTLMGFRNKLNVVLNWMWNYFTYDRSVRIIID